MPAPDWPERIYLGRLPNGDISSGWLFERDLPGYPDGSKAYAPVTLMDLLLPHVRHRMNCPAHFDNDNECNCGVKSALAELGRVEEAS